jgi:S-DNA-T family DNA segregation ATPase FtsK/SpoIIIE
VELIDGLRDRRQREKQLEARRQVIDRTSRREKKRKPPKIKPLQPPPEPSERVEREKQVPLFDAPVTGELPPLELLDPASTIRTAGSPRKHWRNCPSCSNSSWRTSASRRR